jgi:hypothetical protein
LVFVSYRLLDDLRTNYPSRVLVNDRGSHDQKREEKTRVPLRKLLQEHPIAQSDISMSIPIGVLNNVMKSVAKNVLKTKEHALHISMHSLDIAV